jgi:hypothetical protein
MALPQVRRLQGDMVDSPLFVLQETVQKTAFFRGRYNLKPRKITKRKELPEKPGCGITCPDTGNGSKNVTKKIFSLSLISYRYGYMVDT